ncbi:MAG: hypothetical protein Q9191_007166 [Dirinaria sp. TL-2023a]
MTHDVDEAHVNIQKSQSDNDSPDSNSNNKNSKLASKDGTPETVKSSISESPDGGSAVNGKESGGYSSSATSSEREPDILSFTAPLPPPADLKIWRIPIDGQRHPFLSSFLQKRRYTDIPFGTAHRLLNYIMHLIEEAIFDFCMLHTLGQMTVEGPAWRTKRRTCADEVEVQWWVRHLQRHYCEFSRVLARVDFIPDVDDLRLYAVHRWVWSTYRIEDAVGVLALVKDERRMSALEKVLETIYHTYRQPRGRTITDAEKRIADVALGIIPTDPTTVHQLLCRVQELLENACWKFWQEHNPQRLTQLEWHRTESGSYGTLPPGTDPHGWDCPERVELQLWHDRSDLDWSRFEQFPPRTEHYDPELTDHVYLRVLLRNAVHLRNCAAHRSYDDSGRPPLEEILDKACDLAFALRDEAAAKEIETLQGKAFLEPIFKDQSSNYKRRLKSWKEADAEALADWKQHTMQSGAEGKSPEAGNNPAPDTESVTSSTKDTTR